MDNWIISKNLLLILRGVCVTMGVNLQFILLLKHNKWQFYEERETENRKKLIFY